MYIVPAREVSILFMPCFHYFYYKSTSDEIVECLALLHSTESATVQAENGPSRTNDWLHACHEKLLSQCSKCYCRY